MYGRDIIVGRFPKGVVNLSLFSELRWFELPDAFCFISNTFYSMHGVTTAYICAMMLVILMPRVLL
jgi:hypothetical protein